MKNRKNTIAALAHRIKALGFVVVTDVWKGKRWWKIEGSVRMSTPEIKQWLKDRE